MRDTNLVKALRGCTFGRFGTSDGRVGQGEGGWTGVEQAEWNQTEREGK